MSEEFRAKVRDAFTGPVCSLPTPFKKDNTIDYDTAAQIIDFQIENGFKVIFLTPGNSHYNCISDDEMAELAKFCVKHIRKRALLCATEFGHDTNRMKQLASYCAELGVDLFAPYSANWGNSLTRESATEYYLEAAKILPLLMIFPGPVPHDMIMNVMNDVMEPTDQVMVIKDDLCNPLARQMTLRYADRAAIFSGGQKQNFLNIYPYGATGFLSTLGMFRPDITWKFWEACQQRDLETMRTIVRDYDMPYFDLLLRQPGGFDAGIHATMELFGFGSRHRRKPYRTMTDEETENFKQKLIDLKLYK